MGSLQLVHLTYAGSGKTSAQIVFGPELTTIYGASDIGVWDLILDERVKALLDQFSYAPTFVSANSVLPSHQVPF